MGPRRIQRKRTRGWRMPAGAVYVGRPSRWGNPNGPVFSLGQAGRRVARRYEAEVAMYADMLCRSWQGWALQRVARRDLRGRDLVCWCPRDRPCHADYLLVCANTTGRVFTSVATLEAAVRRWRRTH